MFRLADWPIRRKLGLLTASAALVALALACLAFGVHDVLSIRAAKFKQIEALADILAFNVTPALEFSDADTAREVLSSLRLQPSVDVAALFDAEGRLVATYPAVLPRDEDVSDCITPTKTPLVDRGCVRIAHDIHRDGEKIGTICICSNLDEIRQQLAQTAWIIAVVMVAALGVSMLMTAQLQRFFAAPIRELAQTMEQIAANGDYSLQAKKHGGDELGVLCDGFNEMLAQIAAARDQLQRARWEAEQANRAKSDFLANMSHEIRSPMTAIVGFADTLLENAEGLNRSEALNTIKRNGEYLVGIINDILDLSKIEAGKLQVERIACSPLRVVGEVASLMRVPAAAKNLSLEIEYVGPIPERIQSDPVRLRQILINLVSNAVKFTESGSVRLVTRLLGSDGKPPQLRFDVIDTGIGVTEKQIARIFRPFTQADTSTTRQFGGSGLGLTICKRLAGLLGGEIEVQSTPGKGSTFSLTVDPGPLDQVRMLDHVTEEVVEKSRSPKRFSPTATKLDCRVLLVEDGPDNQRLIAFLLKKAGAEVTLADNGRVAVDKVQAASSDSSRKPADGQSPFDVILMDMQMPVLDGYQATRQLRRQGYTGPVIALTAHAMKEDRQKCLDAGCDDYMTKPVERKTLLSMVAKHARKQPKPGEPIEPREAHAGESSG